MIASLLEFGRNNSQSKLKKRRSFCSASLRLFLLCSFISFFFFFPNPYVCYSSLSAFFPKSSPFFPLQIAIHHPSSSFFSLIFSLLVKYVPPPPHLLAHFISANIFFHPTELNRKSLPCLCGIPEPSLKLKHLRHT